VSRADDSPIGPPAPAPPPAAAPAPAAAPRGTRAERRALLRTELGRRMRQTGGRGRKLRGLLALLKPYRSRVIWMLVALVAATAAALAPAPLAKFAIDDGIRKGDLSTLNLVVIAFIVSALVYWGATYVQTYLVGWVGQRALQDLRLRIFEHLQAQPVGFYERRRAGALISRMTNDVQALDQLVTDSVVTLFSSTLTLVGTIAILVYFDLELALLTFLIFPVMALGSLAFRVVSADAYARTRESISEITSYLQESLSGIRILRSFGQEPQHIERFRELNERNRAANMTTVNLNAAYFPAVELMSALATVGILLYGGFQVIHGNITSGVVIAFVLALNGFFDPIQQLSQVYTTYQAGMAALDKIFDLLDIEPDLVDAPGAIELERLRGEIELRDVSFRYGATGAGDHAYAVRDVSLTVPPGQTIALVGSTGAGKSTIAKLVARFYDPTDGAVLVDGHDLRDVTQASLRRQLGIVPQEGFLFSGTIASNIAFGRPGASDDEVRAAARAVGADDFIASLERGYETQVGERGTQLSAGQRQLVAFARALVADPRILILDEATSNVDLHTEGRIETGLRRLLAGRTSIVIAHRLSTIRQAGRIVVLDGGRIVEQGTHDELLDAEGAYWRLYRDWMEQATA
jgi:ABC-type multidrug transport system fused ATPase/permease subunit